MNNSDEDRRTFTECDARTLLAVGDVADPPVEGHAWTRLADAMGRPLYTFERGRSTSPEPCAPAGRGPVESAIELRARTREIHTGVLGHGEAVRRAFCVLDSLLPVGPWQRRREALIALSLAAGQARCLGDRLTRMPSPTFPRPTALAAALGTALADSARALDTAQALLRETADPAGSAPRGAISAGGARAGHLQWVGRVRIGGRVVWESPLAASSWDWMR
ncbi:hypothetical protein [Embleya sp. NPDC005575]|uniref:hypothetical protein n=1 Tax=Embleya sp. NPDC005575 TaxID=3156892 RepID=UPI0033B0E4D5